VELAFQRKHLAKLVLGISPLTTRRRGEPEASVGARVEDLAARGRACLVALVNDQEYLLLASTRRLNVGGQA
jgi:hypothetical protein